MKSAQAAAAANNLTTRVQSQIITAKVLTLTANSQNLTASSLIESTKAKPMVMREAEEYLLCRSLAEWQLSPKVAGPLPVPSSAILSRLQQAHPALLAHSESHLAAMRRMAWAVELGPVPRLELFVSTMKSRGWAPSTAEHYWGVVLSLLKSLSLPVTSGDQAFADWLKARAMEWQPAQATPMNDQEARLLAEKYARGTPEFDLATLVLVSWLLGQRMGDIIQLASSDVTWTADHVIVTIRRGKVVRATGPYALALHHSAWTTRLIEFSSSRQGFLVTTTNAEEDRTKVSRAVALMLASIADHLEVRSIRRGGLLRLAQSGLTSEELRIFSRHTTDTMLRRYLGWGAHIVANMRWTAGAVTASLPGPQHPRLLH